MELVFGYLEDYDLAVINDIPIVCDAQVIVHLF